MNRVQPNLEFNADSKNEGFYRIYRNKKSESTCSNVFPENP